MSWVPRWRERVIQAESSEKKASRDHLHGKIESLRKKQIALSHKIQGSEEEYQRLVVAASLSKAPNQNGSGRRKFLDAAHAEHKAQKALRPSDRQLYSRMYSKVDNYTWQLDVMKEWYTRYTNEDIPPDIPLESYGFKGVWIPANSRAQTAVDKMQQTLKLQNTFLEPLPPPQPRETRSSAQRRIVAGMHKDPTANIHWFNDIAQSDCQSEQRVQHPMYGKVDIACPPFRPLVKAQ